MDHDTFQTKNEHVSPLETILLKFLFGVFICAILGIVVVFISRLFTIPPQHTDTVLNPLSQTEPTPTPHAITTTFQQILSRACSATTRTPKGTYALSLNALPISVNTSIVKLTDNGNFCKGTNSEKYVVLTASDNTVFYIYDRNLEQQTDTDGYAIVHPSPYAETINKQQDYTLTMFLQHLANPTFGEEAVIVQETKSLQLSTGETIFITSETQAIPGNDPRLMQVLSPFTLEQSGKREINFFQESEVETAIKRTFFNNINLMDMPERGNVIMLETVVDAITSK